MNRLFKVLGGVLLVSLFLYGGISTKLLWLKFSSEHQVGVFCFFLDTDSYTEGQGQNVAQLVDSKFDGEVRCIFSVNEWDCGHLFVVDEKGWLLKPRGKVLRHVKKLAQENGLAIVSEETPFLPAEEK